LPADIRNESSLDETKVEIIELKEAGTACPVTLDEYT